MNALKVVIPVPNVPTVGEGGNPGPRNFLKGMDSRLMTSGMTAMKRTFCDVVAIFIVKGNHV